AAAEQLGAGAGRGWSGGRGVGGGRVGSGRCAALAALGGWGTSAGAAAAAAAAGGVRAAGVGRRRLLVGGGGTARRGRAAGAAGESEQSEGRLEHASASIPRAVDAKPSAVRRTPACPAVRSVEISVERSERSDGLTPALSASGEGAAQLGAPLVAGRRPFFYFGCGTMRR